MLTIFYELLFGTKYNYTNKFYLRQLKIRIEYCKGTLSYKDELKAFSYIDILIRKMK